MNLPSSFRASPDASVLLVHGALVKGVEMELLAWRLRRLGYRVRIFRWPSMLGGLEENIQRLGNFLSRVPGETLHVVAHSMGGVLTREVFERQPDPRPGRLIATGSPFLDCWIGRRVLDYRGGQFAVGRTVRDHLEQLSTRPWSGKRELGVVAGTFAFGVGRNFPSMPRPNDGVILWKETRLPGITDHVTFHMNHFGMLLARPCFIQMARFLATGRFDQNGPGVTSRLVLQEQVEMAEPERLARFDKAVVDRGAIDHRAIG